MDLFIYSDLCELLEYVRDPAAARPRLLSWRLTLSVAAGLYWYL